MAVFCEMEQLQGAAFRADDLELGRHHAHSGAVDVSDAAEIDQDLASALFQHQVVDPPPKRQFSIVECDLAGQYEHRDVVNLPLRDLKLRRLVGHRVSGYGHDC